VLVSTDRPIMLLQPVIEFVRWDSEHH